MNWRGFGFVHHSRTLFCRAVPNPNITIRNFFIAVRHLVATQALVQKQLQNHPRPAQRAGVGGTPSQAEVEQRPCTVL